MKCIPQCGYRQLPDNLLTLKKHVEHCLSNGAMRTITVEPAIIWRDNELAVTLAASTDDMIFSGKATVEAAPKKAPRKSRAKK